MSRKPAIFLAALLSAPLCLAWAEEVTVTNQPVYVTKSDCARLVTYHPSPDVAYKPGQDVHGKYVAPADLPGSQMPGLVPDKIEFNLNINPMNYAQRNSAQQKVATTSQALVKNNQTLRQAQAQATTLSSQLTALQTTKSQLSTQQTAYNTQVSTQTAAIIAATGGSSPTASQLSQRNSELATLTAQTTGSAAYAQLQAQETANSAAITQANTAITSNNQAISTATSQQQPLQDALTSAQGQSAALQGKFDNTSTSVGRVSVNLGSGQVTFNGQPLNGEQERAVEEACRGAGVR